MAVPHSVKVSKLAGDGRGRKALSRDCYLAGTFFNSSNQF